ncbi:protein of unknown function [Taphrina deformans PYCC 5710]|uniref:Alpha/beta hydrolase fold-3 domain-containing protein n=1 Tax=Taphrina deformans (strain PYCC 5710 / ATCC 11124 / CBS 356.35 / IMI 108563 / JCM 9778 / NBRC 8474) TaxID=1097556 RepID=R4XJD4_TAPDE|nr:protein of unknown function [Taphrina deformans PYCC 5710]|eukprot:CCG84576.1 protein of unknown function [Taphrina deformans PYCC 5710]
MNDIVEALHFLKRNYDLKHCVLLGHSAGATLAIQVFHQFRREIMAMVLFNGIYDLVALVDEYPEYNKFVSAAFGDLDSSDWETASPTHIMLHTDVKPQHLHELVILAHSLEDELLSMQQSDLFQRVLNKVWGEEIQRKLIHGKHDDSPASRELQDISTEAIEFVSCKLLT